MMKKETIHHLWLPAVFFAVSVMAVAQAADHSRGERKAQRLQQLESRLKLTTNQKSAWNSFEQAALTKLSRNRSRARTAPEKLQRHIQRMEQRIQLEKNKYNDLVRLYKLLTPTQKQTMDSFFKRRNRRRPHGDN